LCLPRARSLSLYPCAPDGKLANCVELFGKQPRHRATEKLPKTAFPQNLVKPPEPPNSSQIPRKATWQLGLVSRQHGELGEVAFLHKAMALGFMVAKPYGTIYPFDFILQGGQNLWRMEIKSVAHTREGLYALSIRRSQGRRLLAYSKSEVDFVAVYIIPEETWYILPVREVVELQTLLFRPKGYPHPDIYAHYREAWNLLREPDGLTSAEVLRGPRFWEGPGFSRAVTLPMDAGL
jgi:PD-(D/E)XK endonuclease